MRGGISSRGRPQPSILLSPESPIFTDVGVTPAGANNDTIGYWGDIITPGVSAFQATLANRPLLQTNFLNGHRAIKFDGANDTLGAAMAAAAAQTWFVVAKKVGAIHATNEDVLLGVRTGTSNRTRPITVNNTQAANQYSYFPNEAVGYTGYGGDPTAWSIIALTATNAEAVGRVGGGAGVVFNPNDNISTAVAYTICTDNSITSSAGDYFVAEVRRYLSVLSFGDLDYVGKELAEKYTLPWTAVA